VIGFHVEYEGNTAMLAEKAGINVRLYDIIYKITEDLQMAAEGMLEPVYEEVILGEAEVRATYRFSKVGMIAGSFVTSGKMVRGAKIRIFRGKDNTKVYEGKLENLKRFKEVETNFECGISIQGYEDFEVGDRIQAFEMRKKEK
jgi:translation initiation factor IF-2